MTDERPIGAAAPDALPLVSDAERRAFLAFIAEHRGSVPAVSLWAACEHIVGANARMTGTSADGRRIGELRARIKQLLAREPAFAEEYADARGYGQDQIRQALYERAIEGYDETTETIDSDGAVETKKTRKVDNRVLALMAKARLPEYADHATVEVRGGGGGAIQVEDRSPKLEATLNLLVQIVGPDAGAAVVEGRAAGRALDGGVPDRALPDAGDVLAEPPER